ncbi:MAG: hypothetical protein IPK28_10645 [Devosia sp.]|nr:hypothetical protein [Devosia sp.]
MSRSRPDSVDPRVLAMAAAVRERRKVRLAARSATPLEVHPVALQYGEDGWAVFDARTLAAMPIAAWQDVNISRLDF